MQKLFNIIAKALTSTSKNPRWWILAFIQGISLILIGGLTRPHIFFPKNIGWILLSLCVLQPITAFLWLSIKSNYEEQYQEIAAGSLVKRLLTSFSLSCFSALLIMVFRFFYPTWTFSAVFSSLILGTSALCMLYALLLGLGFFKSCLLALDAWKNKISLVALSAFALMLAHAFSFAVFRNFWQHFGGLGEFSVLSHSATIWLLLLGFAVIVGYLSAILNSFLVILFLETIKPVKSVEEQKSTASIVATELNT